MALLREGLLIESVSTTGSTNDDLMQRARLGGVLAPTLRVAGRQSKGRGRQARKWLDVPGQSLLMSLACPLHLPVKDLSGLTLACGVVVAQRLRTLGAPVVLKWPNDVLSPDGRKLGGILVEVSWGQKPVVVVGLGLNLVKSGAVEIELPSFAATLDEFGVLVDQQWLAKTLAEDFLALIRRFELDGFEPWRASFLALDCYLNQSVSLDVGLEGRVYGQYTGVDRQGALQLTNGDRTESWSVGEVSLRPAGGKVNA